MTDFRAVITTAIVVMIFTALVRAVAPRVPVLNRVAPYI